MSARGEIVKRTLAQLRASEDKIGAASVRMSDVRGTATFAIEHPERYCVRGTPYSDPFDFVLRHGHEYRAVPLGRRELTQRFRYGQEKACFANSIMAGVLHDDLRYVEGFAFNGLLPIHHAWNVDRAGRAIDFTWREAKIPIAVRAYVGVVFPLELAWDALWEGDAAVLDDWQRDWPILRREFEANEWPPLPGPELLARMRAAAAEPG